MVTMTLCLQQIKTDTETQTDANVVSNNKAPPATIWETPRDGMGAEKLHATGRGRLGLETWVQSSFVTVSSRLESSLHQSGSPSTARNAVSRILDCESVSGVSERRLRMGWLHVAADSRLSCKNMPQEMRVLNRCKAKEGGRQLQEAVAWRG